MKRNLIILISLSIFVLTVGCKPKVMLTANNDTENIEIKKKHKFEVVLTSNPSTGYKWHFVEPIDSTIIKLESRQFIKDTTTANPMMGSAGKEKFTFQGVGKGNTTIKMLYARTPAANDGTIKDFKVTIK